jgi:hypothetical protein
MSENESKDATFRIQERMLREARQSLADTREELAEAREVREECDRLRKDVDNAWRQVALEKVNIKDLTERLAISNKKLIEQCQMVVMLKTRCANLNDEYNRAYGKPPICDRCFSEPLIEEKSK